MTYQTTITKKGQVTIPKAVRDYLKLHRSKKVVIELTENKKEIRIKPSEDFLELARTVKVKKKIDPVKAREIMEATYERA